MMPGWNIALKLTWVYHLVPNKMTAHHLTIPLTQTLTMTVNTKKKSHPPGPFLAPVLALLRSTSALFLLVILEGEAIPSLIVLNGENNKKLNATSRNVNLKRKIKNLL
jgi:hypothetical protein